MKTTAVILAAGAGVRLGRVAKALLAKDGRSFLQCIVETCREVDIAHPIVVVGPPFAAEVGSAADRLGAAVIVNPEPERGMASSVAVGFRAIDEATEAAWLWPVDHPFVAPATLRTLMAALMNHDAARPVYAGRGGHPPLIARSLFAPLATSENVAGGARSVLAAADTFDVVVDDPGCVRDIDTPVDWESV